LVFLDQVKLDSKQVLACLRDLQALPKLPGFAEQFNLGERFMFLDLSRIIDHNGPKLLEDFLGRPPLKPADIVASGLLKGISWEARFRAANQWYDSLVEGLRVQDRAERTKQLNKLDRELQVFKAKVDDPKVLA